MGLKSKILISSLFLAVLSHSSPGGDSQPPNHRPDRREQLAWEKQNENEKKDLLLDLLKKWLCVPAD